MSSGPVFPEERPYTQRLGVKEEYGPLGYQKYPLPLVLFLVLSFTVGAHIDSTAFT